MTRSGWVLSAVKLLNSAESWTGRIHIQKLVFLSRELLQLDPPFEFELYRFGPYSFELDETIRDLSVAGILDREYSHPGYGPSYKATSEADMEPEVIERLNTLSRAIAKDDASRLELIATCLWFEKRLGADADRIVEAVRRVKPRYSESDIRSRGIAGLADLRRTLDT
jgi:uncharacterized protein YwgA